MNQQIPEIYVPLRKGEKEPSVNLKALLSQLYDQARYDLSIDYDKPPEPPSEGDWAKWAESVLAAIEKPQ